mmetsp:Transcript_51343/g.76689  ORF Transcript_51343/g.76689 Transcript_51343/m.76689 type:complete len:82 (-) Transcript_51343:138-383(-)
MNVSHSANRQEEQRSAISSILTFKNIKTVRVGTGPAKRREGEPIIRSVVLLLFWMLLVLAQVDLLPNTRGTAQPTSTTGAL